MFCNVSTREIKLNFSKGNIWKNDMPLQKKKKNDCPSPSEILVSKWNDNQNL